MSVERRPIAAREGRLSQMIARKLAARGVPPNAISMAGLDAGLLAGAALFVTQYDGWRTAGFLAAALFVQLRLLANMFDGMVAIERHETSPVGELYNEVPDRVSDTAIFIGAGYALGGDETLGFIAACVALFVAYVRAQGKVAGAPQDYSGPMAKQQRMFVITVAALYAALAPTAWQPHTTATGERSTMALALAIITAGGVLTAVRRLRRIARTLRGIQG
ncbi:MAG: CDP-alcohol phosphatidyltransferase family protein [Planctomycetes bacterium]|nr:CDP-alcohol phosphatidyltransferase family protein [Planctomycetota bacterium]